MTPETTIRYKFYKMKLLLINPFGAVGDYSRLAGRPL